eukprot:3836879-Pleurochrysis_carterae.AAC.2
MTGSPSTRCATSWETTSACPWLSRVSPTPLLSVTATASRVMASWGMVRTRSRALKKNLTCNTTGYKRDTCNTKWHRVATFGVPAKAMTNI